MQKADEPNIDLRIESQQLHKGREAKRPPLPEPVGDCGSISLKALMARIRLDKGDLLAF